MIAEILRRERKQKGITQQEAAEIFNVTRQTISNWENERNYPDIPTLVAISEYYKISLDYLMKGDNRYMAKMKKEARLMQSIRMGLFSVIAGGVLFLLSMVTLVAAFNGGKIAYILPEQLWITVATIWVGVIHFKNLKEDMTASIGMVVNIFLIGTFVTAFFCLMLLILALMGVIYF